LKGFRIRQDIGNQASGIAGLHWLGIEHHQAKTAGGGNGIKGRAEALFQRQQTALAAVNTVAASKKRPGGARETFGAKAKDGVISHGDR
jgi:hypothetical protein